MTELQKIFQVLNGTEETAIPAFIHSAAAGKIVGVVLVAESLLESLFGVAPPAPIQPAA